METASKVLSVETYKENSVNVETDKGCVPVETSGNDQNTSHVETTINQTTVDQPVPLHVHVETPSDDPKTTECVVLKTDNDIVQIPVKKNQDLTSLLKPAKLVLQPLSELEIDVWCNKTSEYHHFLHHPDSLENSNGYSLRERKPKTVSNGFSLRKTNAVNYAPMLDSDADDTDDVKKAAPNKIRPKLDGPSTAVIHAHAQIQNKKQKTFETKPIPVMPIRNHSKDGSNTPAGQVETDVPPVETTPTKNSETEGYANLDTKVEGQQPVIRTLVMKTVCIV